MEDYVKRDFDKEIRHLINEETNLVNCRMTWLILLQGLLFAGFCSIFDKDIFIAAFIAVIGIVVSIIIRHSFWENEKAIAFILSKWDNFIKENNLDYNDYPPVWAGCFDDILDNKKDKLWNTCTPYLIHHLAIPKLFTIAWLFILCYSIYKLWI